MKLKKMYKYDRGRQIFRIIPTDTYKLLIEERDRNKKQTFYSCLDINSGKSIFQDFQLDEKYWVGVKTIYKDVILFHKFERPDLPKHKGIIAFDINTQTILWENYNSFLFISNDKAVFIAEELGIRKYIAVDYLTGKVDDIIDYPKNVKPVNYNFDNYLFSSKITQNELELFFHSKFKEKLDNFIIKGEINFINKELSYFISFHVINKDSRFDNLFFALDAKGKIILKEILNKGTDKIQPESFFIIDNLLFLLFSNTGFGVYRII
jgi:hypothetical protein